MSLPSLDDANNAVKNLNSGIPLTNLQIQSLLEGFIDGKFFGHIIFGLQNERLTPLSIIKNVSFSMTTKIDFLFLVAFLLNNGLNPNSYFPSVYSSKIHLAVFIYERNPAGPYNKYIFDLLVKSGSNFNNAAITGGQLDGAKTVEEVINYFVSNSPTTINIGSFIFTDGSPAGDPGIQMINIKWEFVRSIMLDKVEGTESFDSQLIREPGLINQTSVTATPPEFDFNSVNFRRNLTIRMIISCSSKNIISSTRDSCLFRNTFMGMKTSVYLAINSQNIKIFKTILDKGLECNYVEMTELIMRHNKSMESDYTKNPDKILADVYSNMILYAVETGSPIDQYQLKMLALKANVDMIEKLGTFYRIPEWEKICKKGSNVPNPLDNIKLRKFAFDLDIDFDLPREKICGAMEKLKDLNREKFIQESTARAEDRIRRYYLEKGEILESQGFDAGRCEPSTMLVNNPYSFNSGRVAYYVDDNGKLWCFTSDLFDSLMATGKNPYNGSYLPEKFKQTLKSIIGVLKLLGVKTDTDMRTISESAKEIFDTTKDINNKNSDRKYNIFVSRMAVDGRITETTVRERFLDAQFLEKFLFISFFFFCDCQMKNDTPYLDGSKSIRFRTGLPTDILTGFTTSKNNIEQLRLHDILKTSRIAEAMTDQRQSQSNIFYVVAAECYDDLYKKLDLGEGSSADSKWKYYLQGKKSQTLKNCIDLIIQ